ncbi:MAG: DEAD/DEAH box helicase, partial [Planctomycetota bacterium]
MNIEDATGPGVDPRLVKCLRSWGINTLTDVQIRALNAGIANGCSMIVSAPTSTGKTLIGEIAVLTALQKRVRTIYLVSHKALADQKYLDFVLRFGEKASDPIASVGLNTGDRVEGEIDAQLMVATYEKALGLILAGQLKPDDVLVVADELQILGEQNRGPEIETLCAMFRQRGIKQFVALTATVENPEDLSGWMCCELVKSFHRDVPLHQQIWYAKRVFQTTFGQEEGQELDLEMLPSLDIIGVVKQLLDFGRGPVLVFTESRREATDYALSFGRSRPRVGEGIVLAEQLDLFSEPTESSEQLRENAERRVAFHSADLSPQERQVIEAGFLGSKFEVCFATSTLAAGVNFPFRSIVFPKLTFQWGDRAGSQLPRADYRNMSGRAGRLGMHVDGYAVLLPRNEVEFAHAKRLVAPTNDHLSSHLVALSLRKTILMLVASGLASSFDEVIAFFRETLYWYQTLERNPSMLASLQTKSQAAIQWLIQYGLLREEGRVLLVTQLGKGTALSGLLPTTAVKFAEMFR